MMRIQRSAFRVAVDPLALERITMPIRVLEPIVGWVLDPSSFIAR
jgi:hypothetical protein